VPIGADLALRQTIGAEKIFSHQQLTHFIGASPYKRPNDWSGG
jgi:hypothetical protein